MEKFNLGWKDLKDLERKRNIMEALRREPIRFLGLIIAISMLLVEFCLVEFCIY